jgi:hypothetical protein
MDWRPKNDDTMNKWNKKLFLWKSKHDQQTSSQLTQRREKTWINKISDEKGNITTDTNEIQNVLWEYFKNLYCSKLENAVEINFLTHMTC